MKLGIAMMKMIKIISDHKKETKFSDKHLVANLVKYSNLVIYDRNMAESGRNS